MNIDLKAVERLLDKEAIREAVLCYSRGVDRLDEELLAQAYHSDATDDHGAYIGNPAGFAKWVEATHRRYSSAHQHYVMNQTVDLDGDMAHVETYYMTAMRRKNDVTALSGGRYVDRMERRDGRWAVADRLCLVEWHGELVKGQESWDPDLYARGTWDRSDPSYQRPLKATRPHRNTPL
jgi:hypothetical protein